MPPLGADSILRRMIRANDDYWDSDRATYEDELGAWRERTAVAVAVASAGLAIRLGPGSGQTCVRRTLAGIDPGWRRSAARAGPLLDVGHAQAARRDRAETRRTGVRPPLTFWPRKFGQKESARIGRPGSLSQPSIDRPSDGNAARSIDPCTWTRRRFV